MTTRNTKIGLSLLVATLVILTPFLVLSFLNLNPPLDECDDIQDNPTDGTVDSSVNVTLLNMAGVMIETNDVTIYIDPYLIPSSYSEFPADLILITHPHPDYYRELDIRSVETEDTLIVLPESMTVEIERHNGLGVKPGDSFLFEQ